VHHWSFLDKHGEKLPAHAMMEFKYWEYEIHYYSLNVLRDVSLHLAAHGSIWRPFLKDSELTPSMKMEIESVLKDVNDLIVSSHASFNQVKSQLRHLQSLVLLSDEDSISIEAVPTPAFEIVSKAEVQVGTFTGAKIPLSRHGEGTQSLAVLMLFFAFLKSHPKNTSILALEEPEAHLHPSATRILWMLIQDFAHQRIISTHSGELISGAEMVILDIYPEPPMEFRHFKYLMIIYLTRKP